MLNMPL